MKQKLFVSLAGHTLTIITDEDEEYVNHLADSLNRRIDDLAISQNRCTKIEALMLCALDNMDSLTKIQAENAELKSKLAFYEKKQNNR